MGVVFVTVLVTCFVAWAVNVLTSVSVTRAVLVSVMKVDPFFVEVVKMLIEVVVKMVVKTVAVAVDNAV